MRSSELRTDVTVEPPPPAAIASTVAAYAPSRLPLAMFAVAAFGATCAMSARISPACAPPLFLSAAAAFFSADSASIGLADLPAARPFYSLIE